MQSTAAVKERPILFSGPMVRAILDGRKTQTRRILKDTKWWKAEEIVRAHLPHPSEPGNVMIDFELEASGPLIRHDHIDCPYGQPGDRLWCVTIKPISGYEELYGAGDDGHIYRLRGGVPRVMRGCANGKGYLTVTLCRDGGRRTALVHNLICSAFYGPRPNGRMQVRHLDGDQSRNVPENLDWGTASQNRADRNAHGKGNGEEHHSAKLTEAQVQQILNSVTWSQRRLAKHFGVTQSTIWAVKAGRSWAARKAPEPNLPRWASRILLEIVSVRVERLRDISETDAMAEGAQPVLVPPDGGSAPHCEGFREVWETINGQTSWDANPWVWLVEFKRVEPA